MLNIFIKKNFLIFMKYLLEADLRNNSLARMRKTLCKYNV